MPLFIVPKFIPDESGALGEKNDIKVVSIEHKLGLKGSPTCLLAFGDDLGAKGWLVGEENRGLDYMFVMMTAARFTVGMQGIGVADLAYRLAEEYALERIQGKTLLGAENASIAFHPDVRRMLMMMRCQIEANRALAVQIAHWLDLADNIDDGVDWHAKAELLIPIHKGHSTECAVEIASLGVQVHGGVGFTEDRAAAQVYRDSRILPIYEGTTAIQANDLIGRKILRDDGQTILDLLAEVDETISQMLSNADLMVRASGKAFAPSVTSARNLLEFVNRYGKQDPARVYAGAVPALRVLGRVFSGWLLCRSALVASQLKGTGAFSEPYLSQKITTARFFADWISPLIAAEVQAVTQSDSAFLRAPLDVA